MLTARRWVDISRSAIRQGIVIPNNMLLSSISNTKTPEYRIITHTSNVKTSGIMDKQNYCFCIVKFKCCIYLSLKKNKFSTVSLQFLKGFTTVQVNNVELVRMGQQTSLGCLLIYSVKF